ncbi:MAG: YdcF family protein [Myxococcota bacterium]
MRDLTHRTAGALRHMVLRAALFAAVAFGCVEALGCASGLILPERPIRPADAIVVLGNRPPTDAAGNVMPETRRRVEQGVALFHAGAAPRMLFAGGPAPHGRVEAQVMADLAESLGVPRDAMTLEERSTDTIENARFSAEAMCDGRDCYPSIVLVSSPYHLQRARELFECAGFRVQTSASADPGGAYGRRFARSERFIRAYYALFDACAAARPEWRRRPAP